MRLTRALADRYRIERELGDQSWDVAPDGRFLFLRPAPGSRVQVRVIRDWISAFRASLHASTRSTANVNAR
jgi:hypothetical protein